MISIKELWAEMGREDIYKIAYDWAYGTGKNIIDMRKKFDDGEKLVKRLVFKIRGEETPGRFLHKLSTELAEYKTNVALALDVGPHEFVFKKRWSGDAFYYLKSAILSGLVNALRRGKI